MSNVTRIEIRQTGTVELDEQSQWYYVGIAGNNEIVVSSLPETYTRREDAARAAEATFPGITISNE